MRKKPELTMHLLLSELGCDESKVGYHTFCGAIWEYVKHLYPPLKNTPLKISCQFNISDIERIKASHGIPFEYNDIKKIPKYQGDRSNDTFIFNSQDLHSLLLNYWRYREIFTYPSGEEKSSYYGIKVHISTIKEYSHRIRLVYEAADALLCNDGKLSFTMNLVKVDTNKALLNKILSDRERVLQTPGALPAEY